MPCISIQTQRIDKNKFEFIQTWYCGFAITGEKIIEWPVDDNDRLKAAILNVGFACRDLYGLTQSGIEAVRMISIESDTDGKDKQYNGEQDILFHLLSPQNRNESRKVFSLYSEYAKYLTRIKQLQLQAEIEIKMHSRNAEHPYATYA